MLTSRKRAMEGNPASPVRIQVFEDLQCSDSAVFRTMMDDHLLPRFGDAVAFEHHDFPQPKHAWARKAAMAARHFDVVKPELGNEFRQYALTHQSAITPENFEAKLTQFAATNGSNAAEALASINDERYGVAVDDDRRDGVAKGISKTPTVLVNGEPFIETFPLEDLITAIESALAGSRA